MKHHIKVVYVYTFFRFFDKKLRRMYTLLYTSSWLGDLYGPDRKFRGVKKRCEKAQKRCEIVDIEEF